MSGTKLYFAEVSGNPPIVNAGGFQDDTIALKPTTNPREDVAFLRDSFQNGKRVASILDTEPTNDNAFNTLMADFGQHLAHSSGCFLKQISAKNWTDLRKKISKYPRALARNIAKSTNLPEHILQKYIEYVRSDLQKTILYANAALDLNKSLTLHFQYFSATATQKPLWHADVSRIPEHIKNEMLSTQHEEIQHLYEKRNLYYRRMHRSLNLRGMTFAEKNTQVGHTDLENELVRIKRSSFVLTEKERENLIKSVITLPPGVSFFDQTIENLHLGGCASPNQARASYVLTGTPHL